MNVPHGNGHGGEAEQMTVPRHMHDWNVTPREAVQMQKQMRSLVQVAPLPRPAVTVAGADISFDRFSEVIYAGVVVVSLETLETVEEVGLVTRTTFPYVPGLLSFREAPAVIEALRGLTTEPDVLMIDGHGLAHPRRFGIASHIGVLLERPALGCGKSVLVGRFDAPGIERGAWSPMVDRGETIGAALRTKRGVQPVYVSVGNLIDLEEAIGVALAADGGYRIPEPTRRAHNLVNAIRRGERAPG
jgi:deoxyribonuclease V